MQNTKTKAYILLKFPLVGNFIHAVGNSF